MTADAHRAAPVARPLAGRRVLLTRPREQAAALVHHFEALGADVLVAPLVGIAPPADAGPLHEAAAAWSSFDWIVFASANAVDALVGARHGNGAATRSGPRLCAVGAATAARLAWHGLRADLVPDAFHAEAAADALLASGTIQGRRVLLPRAEGGRPVIAGRLRAAGARVTEVVAYRTVATPPGEGDPDLAALIEDGRLDVVTFTSPSTLHAFVGRCGRQTAARLLARTLVAVIGPVTAEAAAQLGIRVDVQPGTYTAAALADAVASRLAGADRADATGRAG